ncbi:hypothetical protein TrLO_g11826 [Triparma laevis f. longispina]|uniref:Plastid lipid-associated protein/fibrillin conserved domain-containing protein n=2 Tax=Triparma laevis TaxID=1534972 RepID=A0A9W7B3J1_9STRA|nr:hypothetical protein TrLO_g11826 [Triparma laevis f. longispina]
MYAKLIIMLLLIPGIATFAPFATIQRQNAFVTRSTEFDDSSPSDSADETFEQQQESSSDSTSIMAELAASRDRLLAYIGDEGSGVARGEVETLVTSLVDSSRICAASEKTQMSTTPLLTGSWTLVYSSTDSTRSSPFFPCFTKAFGDDVASQIYRITDSIPEGIKDVGEAKQTFDMDANTLVSRVEVSALNDLSSSIMTTRSTFSVDKEGANEATLNISVGTTKPEKSTIVSKLPDFLKGLAESVPGFPSGAALEAVKKGSGKVSFEEVFFDEEIRVNKYETGKGDYGVETFIWKRASFGAGDMSGEKVWEF